MNKLTSILWVLAITSIVLILIAIILPPGIFAIGLDNWPVTDPSHPWASEINPAIISYQGGRISFGHKVFHLGFLPDNSFGLGESHINASLPFYLPLNVGIGFDTRYYVAGIYTEFMSSILLSREILPRLSLGVKMGFEQRKFARDDFYACDPNDPLLAEELTRNSLNIGWGAYWNPGRWLLGFGMDHMNRADIGFGSKATLPQQIAGAFGYNFGRLTPTLVVRDQGYGLQFGFALATTYNDLGCLRLAYEEDLPFKIEASLNLSRKTSMQYGFDLPGQDMQGASSGSHELVVNYTFATEPEPGRPRILLSSNHLEIIDETVIRELPSGYSLLELENTSDLTGDYLNPGIKPGNMIIITTGMLTRFETPELTKQRYEQFGAELRQALVQHPDLTVLLLASSESYDDARLLQQYLIQHRIVLANNVRITTANAASRPQLAGFKPGHQTITKKGPTFSSDNIGVNLKVPGKTRNVKTWKLLITNLSGKIIKTYAGTERLPNQLDWNLKDDQGHLVPTGQYVCLLQSQTKSGKKLISRSPKLQINYVKRTVTLRFGDGPVQQVSKANSSTTVAEKY